jgi:BCD family chlorophyll transporter-like MFS transporter
MANIRRDPEVNASVASVTPASPEPQVEVQSLPLHVMFRLGLFQMGLGMMSLLTLGVLNRVMIDTDLLAIPATVVGGSLAMHQLVSPARVWFGQLSDAKPLFGLHRTGYVRLGSVLFAVCIFLGVVVGRAGFGGPEPISAMG